VSDKIRINFLHPTNPSQSLTARVPPEMTAAWLVEQLIVRGFIPQSSEVGQYKLQDIRTNNLLHDDQSLLAAGVQDGASIRVIHATTGAEVGPR